MSVERRPSATAPTTLVTLKYPGLRRLAVAPKRNRPANEHLLCSCRSLPFRIPSSQQPGGRLPSPHHHHQAMELFPDGGFVRLQSRGNHKYVHADGDWEGVSLRPLGTVAPLEAVWRVEHLAVNQEAIFLQLQNAAYGRYLSFSPLRAQAGHRGRRVVQGDRYEPPIDVLNNVQGYLWRWSVERVAPNQDYVRLRFGNRDLRANGRLRRWNTFVTVARNRRRRLTTMMQWTVHVVPASPVPLPLLEAPPQPQVRGFAIPLHCIGMELTSASFTWNTTIMDRGFASRLPSQKNRIIASESLRLSLPNSETVHFFRYKTTEPVNSS
jgi:hypothetical protein